MADANYTTPITLDAETLRAIAYALDAQVVAQSRLRSALDHLSKADPTMEEEVDELILEGAQRAEEVAANVREWLCNVLLGMPDPPTPAGTSPQTLLSVFTDIHFPKDAAAVVRAIEGDTEEHQAA